MSPDLKDLLDDAARDPQRQLDVDEIHRRGRRSRTTELVAAAAALALVAGAVAFGVTQLLDERAPAPFISEPPTTPSASETSDPVSPAVVTAAQLEADVFVAVDAADDAGEGHVLKIFPDGSTFTMPVDIPAPSAARMHTDDLGGFVYQEPTEAGSSAEIREVRLSGAAETRVPASSGPETSVLVGAAEGASLVARIRGTTPDDTSVSLLQVGHLGAGTRVVAEDVAGWESAVMSATAAEVAVYVLAELTGTAIVVAPPDAPSTVVWRGGEDGGQEAIDVEFVDSVVVALIRTPEGAQLVTIDPFAPEPAIVAVGSVPLDLGAPGELVVATELTGHGEHVAVNRRTDERWLPALVVAVPTAADSGAELPAWRTFERPGRILLGRPLPDGSVGAPACAGDDAARNAPPGVSGDLHLYLVCSGDATMSGATYRHASGVVATGDVAGDAERLLGVMYAPLDEALVDRGYINVADEGGPGPILVHGVTFDGTTLLVDFDLPERGLGNWGTAGGYEVWHRYLRANLLQFPEVDRLRLVADGSCDTYATQFESTGCIEFDRSDGPPWAAG